MNFNKINRLLRGAFLLIIIYGCQPEKRFTLLSPEETGVEFINRLEETPQMNVFTYLYFYNGGGVAAGDLNGDGLPDLYFTSNLDSNRLYLNKGDFKFEDITAQTNLFGKRGWTTGVAMADVNGDGKLDIYVCQLGDYKSIMGKNQLYINQGNDENGIPQFIEEAGKWGLDLKGFSTQAAFFDYDLDGDLDMYMLNHSVHSNGTYERSDLREEMHPLAGDRLMRNDGDKFTDVTQESGIYSSALGYGLGITIADINWDGYPDIYVGNDFHEDDYLYINNGDGTFSEKLGEMIMHTSRFSMGNDVADLNNDGLPDIVSLDMLPAEAEKLKASAGEDAFDVYHLKLSYGYKHQFSRNTLQLNLGNNKFAEIALLSGIHATDWSWSSLVADFDLDGYRDIFISNGIKRRMNDLDYINFVSNDAIQQRLEGELTDEELALVNEMPVVKIPNYIFKNQGNLKLTNTSKNWGISQESFSNGAIYADLDNDGDLDLVTNNIDQPAFIYKNNTIGKEKTAANKNYLKLKFAGKAPNHHGIGAKIRFKLDSGIIIQENFPTRGFQSTMTPEMIVGLGKQTIIDSLWVIWPDKAFQLLQNVAANQTLIVKQAEATGNYRFNASSETIFSKAALPGLDYNHQENRYIEFNREPLIPHMSSTEGPHIMVADLNGDGLDDLWLPGAKRVPSSIYLQTEDGWQYHYQEAFWQDSLAEEIMAENLDVDNDGDMDLIVVSGGNEFQKNNEPLRVRVYINDGKANFKRDDWVLPKIHVTGGCISKGDFDQDGHQDLFIGGSVMPWAYGESPRSYLLHNLGNGKFEDITGQVDGLQYPGMIKTAAWADLDGNQFPELVIAGEWMPVTIFNNEKGKLAKVEDSGMQNQKGWWQSLSIADLDNDGHLDIIAGNLGLNSKLKASKDQPVTLYYDDFDGNRVKEQLLVYYINGQQTLFATKDELVKQIPSLRNKFLNYADFANAAIDDIFPKSQLENAQQLQATEFRSGVFYNRTGKFEFKPLPIEAQFSPVYTMQVLDYDNDGMLDILGGVNLYDVNIKLGRYDASSGFLLQNKGNEELQWIDNGKSGLDLAGQVRDIKPVRTSNGIVWVVARNDDTLQVIENQSKSTRLYAERK